MASKKWAGVVAATAIGAIGFIAMSNTASADPVFVGGYKTEATLSGAASACTNPLTGGFSITWTLTATSDAPTWDVNINAGSQGGIAAGAVTGKAAGSTSVTTGTASYTGTAAITQNVGYLFTIHNNVPAVVLGKALTASATVSSPCTQKMIDDAKAAADKAAADAAQAAADKAAADKIAADAAAAAAKAAADAAAANASAAVKAAAAKAAADAAAAKAAADAAAAKAVVLAASTTKAALPSTGSNSGMLVGAGLAFGLLGVGLLKFDRKRKLHA